LYCEHRVEQFGAVGSAALPVGPDEGHGTGILVIVHEIYVEWQERPDVGRVGPVLDSQEVARVVPGWLGEQ
jgi:hypothetical protein